MGITIRVALPSDGPGIWNVIGPTIRAGETFAFDRDMSEANAVVLWMSEDRETFVAEDGSGVVGTYYIRANQGGGGSHICNCGYATLAAEIGRGVGRKMCLHSLEHARLCGFRGMQFNFVVSTNTRAVALWESCGFEIVGRLPQSFQHPTLGYVDALVMFQYL